MKNWNEIETVMKKLVEEGKTEAVDSFFFTSEGSGPLPEELEEFREELIEDRGDYEFLWSQTHPVEG